MTHVKLNKKQRLQKMQDKALRRMRLHFNRNVDFIEYEAMEMNRYALPENLHKLEWIHKVISSDPQDALRAGKQVLSRVSPMITYTPLLDGEANEDVANTIERNLEWQWNLANERAGMELLPDVVGSALQYATVAAQVNFLPHQIEALKQFKGRDTRAERRRLKFAQRYGKFSISMRNPKDVYARFSDNMLEDVMYIRIWEAKRFLDYFGGSVPAKLAADILDVKTQTKYMAVYEYIDYTTHSIWATSQHHRILSIDTVQNTRPHFIMEAENNLGFIPWVVRERGTALMDLPEDRLRPLLYGVMTAGHWDTQNMVLTAMASEVIVRMAQARRRVKGPNPDRGFQRDFNEPGGIEKVDTLHEVESLPPDPIDAAAVQIVDLFGGMIGKETVAKFLQNPEATSDVPFSSLNLVFQLGANSLEPHKRLAEFAMSDIFRNMLYFVDKFVDENDPLIANSMSGDVGKQLLLHKGMFDVENINLKVGLTADVPSDIMQKTNWATAQNQNLKMSLNTLHKHFGVTDSKGEIEQWYKEQLDDHFITLSTQADQMKQQIEAQQAQLDAQNQAQQQAQPQTPSGEDPAAGGDPPIQGGAPTREQASGRTVSGQEVA